MYNITMQKFFFKSKKDMKVITVLLFRRKKNNCFRTQNKVLLHCFKFFNAIHTIYLCTLIFEYLYKNLNIGLQKIIFFYI